MGMKKKDLAMLEFEMKLPQRNLLHKVVFDALGNIHHTFLVRNELSLILLGKDILLESSIVLILV